MKRSSVHDLILSLGGALLLAAAPMLGAQETPAAPEPPAEAPPAPPAPPAGPERDEDFSISSEGDNVVVHIGEDARLPADQQAEAVVAIFGSVATEGPVSGAVVALFGNARVSGPVSDDVVAIFGNVYVDSPVGHGVVAVFGDLTLGPNAVINGDVVAVDGHIVRDSAAVVNGAIREISAGEGFVRLGWMQPWVDQALLRGRPLAIGPGLGWAWAVALSFLAFYIVLALLFSDAVNRCVRTIEERPGQTLLAALLTMVLTPVAFLLMLITVLGVLFIPFLAAAMFFAALFGKAVVLAWLGRRVTSFGGQGAFGQAAFPVLIGGLILLGAYCVPVLGMIVYNLAGILGFGAVLYTMVLVLQTRTATTPAPAIAPAPAMAPTPAAAPPAAAASEQRVEAAPSAAVPTEKRAGFWIRMAALAIDAFLVAVVFRLIEGPEDIWLIALAGYGLLMWKLKGATVGNLIFNLQVVRKDGGELNWDTAIVRALSCFLSLLAAGLGFIWIAFDSERQGWHDKIAGTIVVHRARATG